MSNNKINPKDRKDNNWKKIASHIFLSYSKETYIFLAIVVILMFIIIIFVVKPPELKPLIFTSICSILSSIIAAFICASIFTIKEKKYQINSQNTIGEKLSDIDKKIKNIGTALSDIESKMKTAPSDIIKVCPEKELDLEKGFDSKYNSSKKSISVLIHGRTFISTHKDSIISRFNKKGFETKFFFVDPDSRYLDMVARKTNRIVEELRRNINESVNTLIDEYQKSKKWGTLYVYYMELPPMQAVYIFDDQIIECKYYSSTKKGPFSYVIIHKNEGYIGKGFTKDCKDLESESKCVFSHYIDSDNLFRDRCLKEKFNGFSIDDWPSNSVDGLKFVEAKKTDTKNKKEITLIFCYRYYKNKNEFKKDQNYCISQFKKKKEEIAKDSSKLYLFITGFGGEPENPWEIKIYQYGKDGNFADKKTIKKGNKNKLILKDFGYNWDF